MWISWEIQQDILPREGREIDGFWPSQFGVDGEILNLNVEGKPLQATDAVELDRLGQLAVGPERAF